MLKINPKLVEQVRAAQSPEDLHQLVQGAIELEHATIPAYLAAYFTLKLGTNQPVAEIIRSVVVEEMLHMSIASNLLIAIGGRPVINKPGFIPTYPGPLPMNIGGLIVPIRKCSIDLVQNVFMKIEEPDEPIPIKAAATPAPVEYNTIGDFYHALELKLREMGPKAFAHGRFHEEMVDNTWFSPTELFPITDEHTAAAGIRLIVRQGEGTRIDPLDPQNEPAHYYRFEQIVKGRRLIKDPAAPSGFSFGGAPVTLDVTNVWDMQPDPPNPDTLPADSAARRAATAFAYGYTSLLNALHDTFNGAPSTIGRAMGLMYQLRLQAQEVLQTPLPDHPGVSTGLSFTYQPTTA
ncbi:MAG: ferritin-like protein [Caulobacteraceae bacterium]|nr:ferritin-like protein [Caulobacteraceae bacterium]